MIRQRGSRSASRHGTGAAGTGMVGWGDPKHDTRLTGCGTPSPRDRIGRYVARVRRVPHRNTHAGSGAAGAAVVEPRSGDQGRGRDWQREGGAGAGARRSAAVRWAENWRRIQRKGCCVNCQVCAPATEPRRTGEVDEFVLFLYLVFLYQFIKIYILKVLQNYTYAVHLKRWLEIVYL